MRQIAFVNIACIAWTSAAFGHDYWLEPQRFVAAENSPLVVRLHVGDNFRSELERPFQKKATLRFQLVSKAATRDLRSVTKDPVKPLLKLAKLPPGTHWLAMERDVQYITLPAEKFNNYLKHEGLAGILKARRAAGTDTKPGREQYRRYLKCLVQSGRKADDTWKRILKLRLEIVPLSNPAALKPGDPLQVRVLFDGKPLPGAEVSGHFRSAGKVVSQTAATDKSGAATFRINGKGTYLIRLVHMRACRGCPKADWESFWGALTFGVE